MSGTTNNTLSGFGAFVGEGVVFDALSGVADRISASGDDAREPRLTFMKFVFLAGGFAGFLIAAAGSFWAGHQADRVFLDGAVGCLAGALLFRWFWTVLVRGIRETIMARHAAAAAAAPAKNK